jgi:hypothetical protein
MTFKKGDKIRVDFRGTVGAFQPDLTATSEVTEISGSFWTHFLYIPALRSAESGVTGNREVGETVHAKFNAVITGEVRGAKFSTTAVQELLPSGRTGFTHYLYLDSSAVTALEEEEPQDVNLRAPLRYKAGDKVHVSMDVVIKDNKESGLALTSRVRETTGEQWVHFLYLDSRSLRARGKATGTQIHVEWDASVTEDAPTGAEGTTRVYELDKNGQRRSLHYLFLPSDSITGPGTVKQPGTGQQGKGTTVAYEIGSKVRVDILGITGEYEPNLSATNEVREADGSWTHFLYLSSDKISGGSEPGSLRTAGIPVRAKFDAEVIGPRAEGRFGTTKVRELNEDDRNASSYGNYVHYLFLNSGAVTELAEPEKPAAPKAPVAYAKGDTIRVNITGRVSDPRITGAGACSKVAQVTGDARNHYIYLGSNLVTGDKNPGGLVSATFDALVTGRVESGDTEVREIRSADDNSTRFIHFISLDSDAVTLLKATSTITTTVKVRASDPLSAARLVDSLGYQIPPATTTVTTKGSTMSIDRYDTTIDDGDVDSRIEDLESELGYEVVRVRNDEVLAEYDDEDEAEQYIQDEDYDTARVIVREKELDDDDRTELDNLRELRDDLGGESVTYTLYNESFFDDDWAREQASDELGIARGQVDEWPLSLLDWTGDVATERRDALYPNEVEYDGTTFYYDEG